MIEPLVVRLHALGLHGRRRRSRRSLVHGSSGQGGAVDLTAARQPAAPGAVDSVTAVARILPAKIAM